ncbi:hypothetical protein EAH72_33910 [Pseudomonas caspiana]|nr:hypothetical protein [Pseudomonas caspiana]TPG87831.1 hypothetical protein EAH72_33910 [Pseudomonas caspiana]
MNVNLNSRHDWMGNNPTIGNLRIDELILPGTHDSGFDKKSPTGGNNWENTQDVSPAEQIAGGIRVLDLRVQFMPGEAPSSPKRFSIFHTSRNGRTVAGDILGPLNTFYAAQPNAREIIILDFHEFKDFTSEAHLELQQLLRDKIGGRLVPTSLVLLTVGRLWENHPEKTVVLAYNHANSGDLFWPAVSQKWSGDSLNNTTKLKKFMDGVATQAKPERQGWSGWLFLQRFLRVSFRPQPEPTPSWRQVICSYQLVMAWPHQYKKHLKACCQTCRRSPTTQKPETTKPAARQCLRVSRFLRRSKRPFRHATPAPGFFQPLVPHVEVEHFVAAKLHST